MGPRTRYASTASHARTPFVEGASPGAWGALHFAPDFNAGVPDG